MLRHLVHSTLVISTFLVGEISQARDITIPYTGRFVEANAKPVEGPVDIVIDFYSKEAGGESLASPQSFPAVALEDGVFQLNIALSSAEFHKMIPSVDSPLWLQVTDATNGAVYPRQAIATSAFALKVPVDGTTISWNSEGQLELNNNAVVNKVGGQTFVTSGASAGQVLGWDAGSKTWKPTNVSFSGSSIANDGVSGDKIDGGTISNFASTGIDDNASSNAITINGSGKVGIGTTNPTSLLNLVLTNPTASDGVVVDFFSNLAYVRPSIITRKARGTAAAPLILQDGDVIGGFNVQAYDGSIFRSAATIRAEVTGVVTPGESPPTTLNFFTSDASGVETQRLAIGAGGNVGIGTTAPTETLAVSGNIRVGKAPSALLTVNGVHSNVVTTITASADTSGYPTSGTLLIGSEAISYTGISGSTFTGCTRAVLGTVAAAYVGGETINNYLETIATSATTPKMVVTGDGKVGIGTALPFTKFEIVDDSSTLSSSFWTSRITSRSTHEQIFYGTLGLFQSTSDSPAAGTGPGISFQPYAGSNVFFGSAAIKAFKENGTVNDQDTALSFWTRTGSSNYNVDSEKLRITGAGNVGIGIKAPVNTLSVSPVQYSTGTASQSTTTVTGVGTTWTSGMVGSQLVFADGTSAGTITAFGSATSLTVSTSQTVASQGYTINYAGMNVTSTGSVGIGTSSPSATLAVEATSGAAAYLKAGSGVSFPLITAGDTNGRSALFGDSTMTSSQAGRGVQVNVNPTYGAIQSLADVGTVVIAPLALNPSGGNVGVGTTNPQTTLDVNGTAKLAKYLNAPYACDLNHDGAIALTTANYLCVCINGTGWRRASDGSTLCSSW